MDESTKYHTEQKKPDTHPLNSLVGTEFNKVVAQEWRKKNPGTGQGGVLGNFHVCVMKILYIFIRVVATHLHVFVKMH